jgi:glycosyltransferase involved in cell wall biosynthesis
MAEPIRVAQVLNRMDSGGIESVVMNYYRHMDRSQVQFDFYLAEDSSFPQRQELEQLGAGIYLSPSYSKPFTYHSALYKAFREKKYRIVHAHLSTMSVFPLFAAWRAGVPVRICHNHTTAYWGEGSKTLLKYLLRPFNKVFATDYFACGETAGRWMYGDWCFDSGRVTVMPNAIDTEKFAFDPEARVALRDELGIAQDAFVVGHVGRFMYQKNHGFLIDIFTELQKEKPETRLLLVGEGELMGAIESKVKELGLEKKVIFTGARRDVSKLYSAMDVLCLPSFYEGMPVVAWEAQVNGLPCVFSDKVSKEAKQGDHCCFLDLAQGLGEWVSAILRSGERLESHVLDIQKNAEQLEFFYEQNSETCDSR